MRIAALSDVHGNLLALEAVMRDLRRASPDIVVNLGDHVSGPLWAAGTADMLMAQRDWLHVRGNHDRQIADQPRDAMGKSDSAAVRQLKQHHLDWLASLPAAVAVTGRRVRVSRDPRL